MKILMTLIAIVGMVGAPAGGLGIGSHDWSHHYACDTTLEIGATYTREIVNDCTGILEMEIPEEGYECPFVADRFCQNPNGYYILLPGRNSSEVAMCPLDDTTDVYRYGTIL